MTAIHERYSELLTLTKKYLLQEHLLNERIFSEKETYNYFRQLALKQQEKKIELPVNKTTPLVAQSVSVNPFVATMPLSTIKSQPHADDLKVSHEKIIKENLTTIQPLVKEKDHVTKTDSQILPDKQKLNKSPFFVLEPPPPIQSNDFQDLRKIIQEKLPTFQLKDQLPDDAKAKILANQWAQAQISPQILILLFDENPKHIAFFKNISKALTIFGIEAQVANGVKLEQDRQWNSLFNTSTIELILASSSGFYHLPDLQKKYREDKQGHLYLGDRRLFLLSDLSFYFKDPSLKSSLWKILKELLPHLFNHK